MEDRPRDGSMYENPRTRAAVALCPRDIVIALIALTDTESTGAQNAADCDAAGRGWEFAADKFGDGKFPIFVSRSRRDRPHSELMATVSSAAAAEMNPAAEQMARAKYPKPFVVRSVIFCECGQVNSQNMLPKI